MAIDQVDQTVVTQEPTSPAGQQTVRTERSHTATRSPGASEMSRRIIILVFGIIQILIAARIVLLLLDAREANGLVSAILNVSQLFVAPFEGSPDGLSTLRVLSSTSPPSWPWSGGRSSS